ncbi:unnamed protein product [Heterobilharzia americana]|nr:unnamed protein product [Heterobilharzia americana]
MNREVSVEINDTYSILIMNIKTRRNNSFKKCTDLLDLIKPRDMQLALKYFDKCIQVCLKNNLHKDKRLAIIYRNRSLIHLQTNEYRLALNDCTLALSIEPNCPIATYRKAMALKFLGDYVNCIQNLEKAKDLCPTNNKIIEELNKVKYMLAQKARLNTETSINHSKALGTSTMNATSDIEIVELPNVVIGEEEDEHREVEVVDEDDDDYDRLSTIQYDKIASSSYNTADVSKKHLSDTSPTCKPIDADWEVVNLVKQQNERNTTIKTMNITSSIVKHTIENKQITTPHEFQTCWIDIQHLKKSNVADATNRIITLLDSISSEQLPKLIGIRMEAEMLDDLLTAIDVKMKTENGNDLQIYEILINLSKTERFDCALFLINEQTVQAIKNILARFHHNQELKQDQVEQLQLIYSL